MKKTLLLATFIYFALQACTQTDINSSPYFEKYKQNNIELIENGESKGRVIFIGNSITEGWPEKDPEFFTQNNYIGRGISGQTSPQVLLRFRKDVVELQPSIVVINIGTNDIAENTGKYNSDFTLGNIISMVEIAQANSIQVILCSLLPVDTYPWRFALGNVTPLIDALNENIKNYALENNIPYADYNSVMRHESGGMIKELSKDGVHPEIEGYKIMESVIQPIIANMLEEDEDMEEIIIEELVIDEAVIEEE